MQLGHDARAHHQTHLVFFFDFRIYRLFEQIYRHGRDDVKNGYLIVFNGFPESGCGKPRQDHQRDTRYHAEHHVPLRIHVIKGLGCKIYVICGNPGIVAHILSKLKPVFVAKHACFGESGGPGGVLQIEQIILLNAVDAAFHGGLFHLAV